MEHVQAVDTLSALAHGTRLRIYQLLAAAGPSGMPAGGVAEELQVPANALSGHLGILARARLVSQERQGRSIIYRACPGQVSDLAAMLLEFSSRD